MNCGFPKPEGLLLLAPPKKPRMSFPAGLVGVFDLAGAIAYVVTLDAA